MAKALRGIIAVLLYMMLAAIPAACDKNAPIRVRFDNPDGSKTPWFSVELALTEGQRAQGLMYRKELPLDRGMLFVFTEDAIRGFWMKNTYIPLDIIYINSEKIVVSVTEKARPFSETSRKSEGPAMFVLELNGGASKEYKIQKGSRIIFSDQPPVAVE